MSKRKRPSAFFDPRTVLWLGLAAVLLFGLGQLVLFVRSDRGAVFFAKTFGIGGETRVAEILGGKIRDGLETMHVSPDSIAEARGGAGGPARRWRVGLGPGASLIQTNYAIARRVEAAGGRVLSGYERIEEGGTRRLTLIVGLERRPTHELVITTPRVSKENAEREPARMAIVLYGFGEDAGHAAPLFDMQVPFAAAIVPGARWSTALFDAAHDSKREVVLMLPLEPINYPNVNPGPGTILVTMNAKRVAAVMKRHFVQAGDVTAVANHMGSLATQDMTVMTAVFDELKRRHLAFIHVNAAPGAVCRDLAADLGLVYDEPNLVFDPDQWRGDRRARDREWENVLAQARARGRFMVWIPASKTVLDWLPGALSGKELQGVHLVPLSAVMQQGAR
jgi:polysaccharide deacetylase 2 family uncharacterized protein YibQ